MTLQAIIDDNRKYIYLTEIRHQDDVFYHIELDVYESGLFAEYWRNTAEKLEQIRAMKLLQTFGEFENCLTKTTLMLLVTKGWTCNHMKPIIDIFRQRIQQHETVNNVLQDTIESKQEDIENLRKIIANFSL